MERRWLLLYDCTALVLDRRQLGEDDARQCVKAMLLDHGSRLHVRIWQRNEYGQLVPAFRRHLPDFWALHVDCRFRSIVTAPPYGKIERLEIDRADFVALLDDLCPAEAETAASRGRKSIGQTRSADLYDAIRQSLASLGRELRRGDAPVLAEELRHDFTDYTAKYIAAEIRRINRGK